MYLRSHPINKTQYTLLNGTFYMVYLMDGWGLKCDRIKGNELDITNRGPAPFHRLTPNKRFEPVFSTVIMAVCSLFNRMLLLTDLIPLHLLYCGQTVMIGCNHTSFEWTRAVRHIYGIFYVTCRASILILSYRLI